VGAAHASDAALMAMLCDEVIQILCGAVSPRLVWEGARKRGLDSRGLIELANNNPSAVADLMWI
jgi:hypothetical protein